MAGDEGGLLRRRPVLLAVLGTTVVSLVARFVLLGHRVAHWDEGRVGYWILDFAATGEYYYRPIIHGPFYHHLNVVLFDLFGATDFSMRIGAALVGGLLPLSALLFRTRLRRGEVVALALFLAANPLLLYYSRFMRGDIIVAAFSFLAFAFVVRGIDVGEAWYLLPASVAFALGFAAKENALVYLIAWLGAAVLVVDHRLLVSRVAGSGWLAALQDRLAWGLAAARGAAAPLVASGVAFLAVIVFFYAPRGSPPSNGEFYRHCNPGGAHIASMDGVVPLGDLLANPGALPAVVLAATAGPAELILCQWVDGATGSAGNPYLDYLGHLGGTIAYGASALVVLAIIGIVVDRYGRGGPRDVVMFAGYWGVLSLAGYPLVTDIKAPWAAVHVVLPLAIPAAVGAALLVRWGSQAADEADYVSAVLAALLVVLVIGQVLGMVVYTSYAAPQADDNRLVQFAQPAGQMQGTLADADRLAAHNERGPDILLYGDYFVDGETESDWRPPCSAWFDSLPLPWYWERSGANVTCAETPGELNETLNREAPPLVITRTSEQASVSERLDGYEVRVYPLRTSGTETAFFLDREALAAAGDQG